jgi:hypothetical protein
LQPFSNQVDSDRSGTTSFGLRDLSGAVRRRAEVVLIGFQDQGNLGMGYLAAVLQRHGVAVEMMEIRENPEVIVGRLLGSVPDQHLDSMEKS